MSAAPKGLLSATVGPEVSNPMRYTLDGLCAVTARGHTTAAPSKVRKLRRLMHHSSRSRDLGRMRCRRCYTPSRAVCEGAKSGDRNCGRPFSAMHVRIGSKSVLRRHPEHLRLAI